MPAGPRAPVVALTVEVLDRPHYEGQRRYQLFTDYAECLWRAGATPFLVPGDTPPERLPQLLDRCDAVLLTGGDDLDLRRCGGPAPTPECKPVPAEQQRTVFALARLALERHVPVLGVCLGMQALGVLHGAPLCQHLEQAERHLRGRRHPVRLSRGSRLARVLGLDELEVPSFHHQALAGAGTGLDPVGWSDDDVLEGLEVADHPFALGVQWHPERTAPGDPSQRLFSALVAAARGEPS